MLTGTTGTPMLVDMFGHVDIAGIRFRPGGAGPFLGVKASEFTDSRIDLSDLTLPLASLALDLSGEASSPASKIQALETLMLEHLSKTSELDDATRHIVSMMARSHGNIAIQNLSENMAISRRTLERCLRNYVGVSAKTLTRTMRLRHALEVMRTTKTTGARLAAEAGYFDQAHFNREFKRMTGTTPTRFTSESQDDAFIQYPLPRLG